MDDEALAREYERADVLVSPSLHEGLCVPVIEAYAAGCNVVGTDAGNLPYVVQPPDPVVPAGDPDALAEAIVASRGRSLPAQRSVPAGAAALVATHSRERARAELIAAVAELGPFRREAQGCPLGRAWPSLTQAGLIASTYTADATKSSSDALSWASSRRSTSRTSAV